MEKKKSSEYSWLRAIWTLPIYYGHSPVASANRRKRNRSISRREHNGNPASPWRTKREFQLSTKQANSFVFFFFSSLSLSSWPPFVLRLPNYIPRALNVARSLAIIAVCLYSRASCTHILREVFYVTGISYPLPPYISQICRAKFYVVEWQNSSAQTTCVYAPALSRRARLDLREKKWSYSRELPMQHRKYHERNTQHSFQNCKIYTRNYIILFYFI